MHRSRATMVALFASLGFFYCVAGVERVVWLTELPDAPSRPWLMTHAAPWLGGALVMLVLACWAIYYVWLNWNE